MSNSVETNTGAEPTAAAPSGTRFAKALCAIDGTAESLAAVGQAARLAGPEGLLTLLLVTSFRFMGDHRSPAIPPLDAEHLIEQAVATARQTGVDVRVEVDPASPPSHVILDWAEGHDVLAIGAPATSWFGGMFLGGVAAGAERSLITPLLIGRIMPESPFRPHVLVASDGQSGSDELVALAAQIALAQRARVTLVHAAGPEWGFRPHRIGHQLKTLEATLDGQSDLRVEVGNARSVIAGDRPRGRRLADRHEQPQAERRARGREREPTCRSPGTLPGPARAARAPAPGQRLITVSPEENAMTEHLTALDATFLELEEVDESAHMHIGGIMVFDPIPGQGAPKLEQVRDLLGERLGTLPRYRQRLSRARTGGFSWPAWEEDPQFDIRTHVTRAAIPAPGEDEQLQQWASAFFSQRLDRHRPLWETVLLEGLAGGRWALATKTHHCMVDGVGSVDVGHLLLDASPDPAKAGEPLRAEAGQAGAGAGDSAAGEASSAGAREQGGHGPLGAIAHLWSELLPLETLGALAQAGMHGALHPRETLSSARAAVEMIVTEELRGAPPTSLNKAIGTRRRFQVVRVPLEDLREIKGALGGTVNDVVLTATASGLRALLKSRGEKLPENGVRAMVPMNVRQASEQLALGNKISSLFIDLPVLESDPLRRYAETTRASLALKKDGKQAAGTSAVLDFAGLAPPVLHATIAQALYATRLFNLTITNVPGPRATLYAFGAPLREIHPLVPLAAEHALGLAVLSYDGTMFFGIVADRDAVPDLDVLIRAITDTLAQLRAQARGSRAAAERDAGSDAARSNAAAQEPARTARRRAGRRTAGEGATGKASGVGDGAQKRAKSGATRPAR